MVLSKNFNEINYYLCNICKLKIDEIKLAATCCLCDFKAHKNCNRKRLSNYFSLYAKNDYPLCNNCKDNTLPFQKPENEIRSDLNNNTNLKKFFNNINENNLENIIDIHDNDIELPNCKYVDFESFRFINDEKNLSILHMNIASLAKHKDEFETALNLLNYKFDIIGLTETKLQKDITPNYCFDLEGYKSYYTSTEASKGGTILYINDKFNSKPRIDLEILVYKSKQLESSFIEIINEGNQKNIIIGCIYRHPSMDLNEFNDQYLNDILSKLSIENKKVFLLGDFNANLMKIDSTPSISNYFDIFSSHLYIPHIFLATRIMHNQTTNITTKTLIDNIFSNSLNYSEGFSGNITFSISDHLAQFLIIPVEYKKISLVPDKYIRDTKHFDRENFLLDMLEVDWNTIIKTDKNDPNFSFKQIICKRKKN